MYIYSSIDIDKLFCVKITSQGNFRPFAQNVILIILVLCIASFGETKRVFIVSRYVVVAVVVFAGIQTSSWPHDPGSLGSTLSYIYIGWGGSRRSERGGRCVHATKYNPQPIFAMFKGFIMDISFYVKQ